MPTYTFKLRDGDCGLEDRTGVSLPDLNHARRYARDVARELMSHREGQTRYWRLDVYGERGEQVFTLPFASVDSTLDHLLPEFRARIEQTCDQRRSLCEAIFAAHAAVREAQALVSRSRGKPYVASRDGQRTIRGDSRRL